MPNPFKSSNYKPKNVIFFFKHKSKMVIEANKLEIFSSNFEILLKRCWVLLHSREISTLSPLNGYALIDLIRTSIMDQKVSWKRRLT